MVTTFSDHLAYALDPVALAAAVRLQPDPWQCDLLRDHQHDYLVNCSRQSGKSTMAALKSLHLALYRPESLALLVSAGQRQSGELFKRAVQQYRRLGRPVVAESENALSLTLENGSRIVSLPSLPSTVRGYSDVDLIVVDEAAQVPDEMLAALRPMQATTGAQFLCLSTPYGQRGFFFEEWTGGSDRWKRIRVPADQCPRIDPKFLEAERQSGASWYFKQEYQCQFAETTEQIFSEETIAKMFDNAIGVQPFIFGGTP